MKYASDNTNQLAAGRQLGTQQLNLTDVDARIHEGRSRAAKRGAANRRPRRMLGFLVDAGDRYRAYRCRRCGLDWELFITDAEEARQHLVIYRPCPACNSREVLEAWGQADELKDLLAKLERDAEAAR